MSDDIKNAVSEMGEAFDEFKKAYDQKLENVAKGVADPLLDGKIDAIEAKMNSLEDVNQQLVAQKAHQEKMEEQMDRLETALRRPATGFGFGFERV